MRSQIEIQQKEAQQTDRELVSALVKFYETEIDKRLDSGERDIRIIGTIRTPTNSATKQTALTYLLSGYGQLWPAYNVTGSITGDDFHICFKARPAGHV